MGTVAVHKHSGGIGLRRTARFVADTLAVSIYVTSLFVSVTLQILVLTELLSSRFHSPLGWCGLAVLACLSILPLREKTPDWGRALVQYSCEAAERYFPLTVTVEEGAAFSPDKPYIFGYEPHSVLPAALPAVFSTESPLLPKALQGRCHILASSVCFTPPIVRHLYWWLGIRSVARPVITSLLEQRRSVVIIPGGVQECLLMERDQEMVYLTRRQGFVRLALQHGVPLVPVYAFGQNKALSWIRPGPPFFPTFLLRKLSRSIGVVPMAIYGKWFTTIPHQVPIHVVIGRPMEVPLVQEPSAELVQRYLDEFIDRLRTMFESYKEKLNCGHQQLLIL